MPEISPRDADAVRAALDSIHRDYGAAGLDSAVIVDGSVDDVLRGAPEARRLILAAAGAGVGRQLGARWASMSPAEAVDAVAALRDPHSGVDEAAYRWIVAEYARLLGHPVTATPAPAAPAGSPAAAPAGSGAAPGKAATPAATAPATAAVGQPAAKGAAPAAGQAAAKAAAQAGVGKAAVGGAKTPGAAAGRAAAPVQPKKGRILDDTTEVSAVMPAAPAPAPRPHIVEYVRAAPPPPPKQSGRRAPAAGWPPAPPGYPPPGYGGDPGYRKKRSKAPLIVGLVIALAVAAAIVGIVKLSSGSTSSGNNAAGRPTRPGATAPGHTPPPTTAPGTPTTLPSVTADPPAGGAPVPLASVMPADVDVSTCHTTDSSPFMQNVTAYFQCVEAASATLPYLKVWGYQFADRPALDAGFVAFNAFVKLDPTQAETQCPPTSTYGSTGWNRNDEPGVQLGTLECYSDSSENHYYVWTDTNEYTIIVAESNSDQKYDQLDAWWRANNRNR